MVPFNFHKNRRELKRVIATLNLYEALVALPANCFEMHIDKRCMTSRKSSVTSILIKLHKCLHDWYIYISTLYSIALKTNVSCAIHVPKLKAENSFGYSVCGRIGHILVVVVFVFSLVLAVVVNRICFVFIVERCPLLLCFVYWVLFEYVVTLCMCYLSVVSYCCTTAAGLKPNCS
jgi:ammonia channel protein AmtB